MAAGHQPDRNLGDRQHGPQAPDQESLVVLIKQLGPVDEHQKRDRVRADLRGVVELGQARPASGWGRSLGLDGVEDLVELRGRQGGVGLAKELDRQVQDLLDALALAGRCERDRRIGEARQLAGEVLLIGLGGCPCPWPGPTC